MSSPGDRRQNAAEPCKPKMPMPDFMIKREIRRAFLTSWTGHAINFVLNWLTRPILVLRIVTCSVRNHQVGGTLLYDHPRTGWKQSAWYCENCQWVVANTPRRYLHC